MTSAYAHSPKYAAAAQRHARGPADRSLPVVIPEEQPQRVGWIVAVPLTAFALGAVAGAMLATGVIRATLR